MRSANPIRIAVFVIALQLCFGVANAATISDAKPTTARKPVVHSTTSHARKTSARNSHGKSSVAKKSRVRGQAAPSSERTREIQTALIREHYLSGEPSGAWDDQTRNALTKFQADHGWQSKVVPDSRALIKLGLGPSRDGLLNPDTAAVSPHEVATDKPQPGGAAIN